MGLSLREQLHRSTSDYFTAKDVRGSSPAASLAADLSQNFRIDNEARLVDVFSCLIENWKLTMCLQSTLPNTSPSTLYCQHDGWDGNKR